VPIAVPPVRIDAIRFAPIVMLTKRFIADDCGDAVNAGDTCADPSWTLYEDAFEWCCVPDKVGIALSDGECKPKEGTYSYYATTVRPPKYLLSLSYHQESFTNFCAMAGRPIEFCTTS
jgi:hypothetical protein